MTKIIRTGLIILGLSGVLAAAGSENPAIQQHRPGHRHAPIRTLTSDDKGTHGDPSGSTTGGGSGSMNFKPLLGGDPQTSNGTGGDAPNGSPWGNPPNDPPGNNPPQNNPPQNNPPQNNPPDDGPSWGGPIGGGSDNPGGHTVPEIDPASGMSALTLLSGAIVVIRGRKKSK